MTTARLRLPWIDVARGAAIALMAVYHFCWDLTFFDLVRIDLLHDPFWLALRTVILSAFLLLVGISLVLTAERGLTAAAFLRRLALLVAAALAITAASYRFFPDSPIFFGVLHHIAVASILGLAFVRLPALVTAGSGGLALLAPTAWAHPWFDGPMWLWLGLATHEPVSNDFVPLLPWFGVVLLGIATGRLLVRRPSVLAGLGGATAGPVGRALAWCGRRSLAIYLLHQPILLGLLYAGTAGLGLASPSEESRFLASCEATCRSSGVAASACTHYCRCVTDDLKQSDRWPDVLAGRIDASSHERILAAAGRCRDLSSP
ncbi:MAG TPA: heparan-alpha-glucosaminide N-acetyltransferase [Azospirillaceae bacterium]|nr:heparan-alpha-glucosaminide N-acetyltransferase [Azospirillaceae bacterium]